MRTLVIDDEEQRDVISESARLKSESVDFSATSILKFVLPSSAIVSRKLRPRCQRTWKTPHWHSFERACPITILFPSGDRKGNNFNNWIWTSELVPDRPAKSQPSLLRPTESVGVTWTYGTFLISQFTNGLYKVGRGISFRTVDRIWGLQCQPNCL